MGQTPKRLTVHDHRRDAAGMRYVYAVVSRRARGVSVGVNLNPNNACNWQCIYCQVPNLVRGKGPAIDLPLLQSELDSMLEDIVDGDFMQRRVPEDSRVLRDIALSGNGEPTTSPDFGAAVDIIIAALTKRQLLGKVRITLITNGTMLAKTSVATALTRMHQAAGQIWFKLDRATMAGAETVNGQAIDVDSHVRRLVQAASLCETWIQTCMFAVDGEPPSDIEQQAYLDCVGALLQRDAGVAGVLLYSLARPSHQPEAARLTALPLPWLEQFAAQIEKLGLPVQVHA